MVTYGNIWSFDALRRDNMAHVPLWSTIGPRSGLLGPRLSLHIIDSFFFFFSPSLKAGVEKKSLIHDDLLGWC